MNCSNFSYCVKLLSRGGGGRVRSEDKTKHSYVHLHHHPIWMSNWTKTDRLKERQVSLPSNRLPVYITSEIHPWIVEVSGGPPKINRTSRSNYPPSNWLIISTRVYCCVYCKWIRKVKSLVEIGRERVKIKHKKAHPFSSLPPLNFSTALKN